MANHPFLASCLLGEFDHLAGAMFAHKGDKAQGNRVIHPMANAMAMSIATQDLAMRTDIRSFGFIKEEISLGEKALFPVFLLCDSLPGMDPVFESLLSGKVLVALSKLDVGYYLEQEFIFLNDQKGV